MKIFQNTKTSNDPREGCQSPSPEVVFTAVPHSTVTEPMAAKECVQSMQWWPPTWMAVGDIFILFFYVSA